MARMWIITCDRCGAECVPGPSPAKVNEQARKDGWRLGNVANGHQDVCPACRQAAARSSRPASLGRSG